MFKSVVLESPVDKLLNVCLGVLVQSCRVFEVVFDYNHEEFLIFSPGLFGGFPLSPFCEQSCDEDIVVFILYELAIGNNLPPWNGK